HQYCRHRHTHWPRTDTAHPELPPDIPPLRGRPAAESAPWLFRATSHRAAGMPRLRSTNLRPASAYAEPAKSPARSRRQATETPPFSASRFRRETPQSRTRRHQSRPSPAHTARRRSPVPPSDAPRFRPSLHPSSAPKPSSHQIVETRSGFSCIQHTLTEIRASIYPLPMSLMPATDAQQNTPGHLPSPDTLVNLPRLVTAFYALHPDAAVPAQRVSFGTSGHRGSAFNTAFNVDHILAITQAICDYRHTQCTTGPLFLAQDAHALSEPAFTAALEVLAANHIAVCIDQDLGYTPTPALSHAILTYNAANPGRPQADGIVITPSHNPPEDGGFKYNPPNGGPADTTATKWIENRANDLIAAKFNGVKRIPFAQALAAGTTHRHDFITAYVTDLANVIDFDALKGTTLKLAVDPLGGAGVHYWPRIAEQYKLPLKILNPYVDPTFRFMTL